MAVVGFTRGEMFSTAHGGERLHSCDVCGAMVSGDRTGRHAKFHRGEGSWAVDDPEPQPEPKRRMNEQIRCPDPHCGWRTDTAGMAAFREGLGELRTHYVNAHVATPPPPTPSHPVRYPPGTDHTTAANRRGYASGMRWTCNRAGHPVDPTSFDGPAGERCICGTWAAGVEEGTIR